MSSIRDVAIAGAGIAGLTAGVALAQRGMTVTVYERSADPREFGAGIYLKENSLPVLDALGIGDRIAKSGQRLYDARIHDERNKTIVRRSLTGERLIVVLRSELHNALRDAAEKAGVEIVTKKVVTGATPDGTLQFADGTETHADLVIAADGVRSQVRESLNLTKSYRVLADGATRLLIPRREESVANEYWSGNKRIGVAPCSEDLTYVFMIGPENDARVGALPVDCEYWESHFPHLSDLFDRITPDAGVHHAHQHVVCHDWVAGRVVIIGDAAHAQPPNFGQGAGLAIVAAWELARTVADSGDPAVLLADWERRVRPGVDSVQKYTTLYSYAGYYWPSPALDIRSRFFQWLSVLPGTSSAWEYWWRGGTYAPKYGPGTQAEISE
jgi:2-polyprenyl-6-methoxyphenol hydroxylase-like FAD-dependent oxidoreductase